MFAEQVFFFHANQTHFHLKRFARGLVLKQWHNKMSNSESGPLGVNFGARQTAIQTH